MTVKALRVSSWCGAAPIRRLSLFLCSRTWAGWGLVGLKQPCGSALSFLEAGGHHAETKPRIEDHMRDWPGHPPETLGTETVGPPAPVSWPSPSSGQKNTELPGHPQHMGSKEVLWLSARKTG